MKLNPPLIRNGVEVTSINEGLHTIHFVIHVGAAVNDIQTLEMQAFIVQKVQDSVKYLEMEGFVAPKQKWLTHMGVILHPPDDSGSIHQA